MASVFSPADVVNVALSRMGFKLRVGSLFEGSPAAKAALDIYAQTRDQLLRQDDWEFAERNLILTLLKQAPVGGYIPPNAWSPAFPPLPWLYEYLYPTDCIKIRAVKPASLFVPNFDPQPYTFGIANDNALVPPVKVILSNAPNAILVYTGTITDPTTWEADFVEAMASALSRRLAPTLVGLQAEQIAIPDEANAKTVAEMQRG